MNLDIAEHDLLERLGDWSHDAGPLYAALADHLEVLISEGSLPPGARLPAERRLADALAVSRGTVVAAYDRLREDDLVRTRHGSGTVITGGASPIHSPREAEVATLLRRNQILAGMLTDLGSDGIDLRGAYWVGIDDLPEAALNIDKSALNATGHGYYPAGLPLLREALAAHITGVHSLATTPGQVIVATGAQQGIALVAELLVSEGDEVLVEELTYPTAIDVFATVGARIRWAPVRDNGADVSAFVSTMRRLRPRLAYVTPSVNNPTGQSMPNHARRLIAEAAAETDTILIDDVSLAETRFDGQVPLPLHTFAPDATILTIGSMSKSMWGGLRLGWVRGEEATLARLARLKGSMDLGTPVASQLAGARLLPHADHIRDVRRLELRRRYDLLTGILGARIPEWTWTEPDGGLCLWTDMGRGDSAHFAPLAAQHRVGIAPGAVSSTSGQHARFLRLPYGQLPEVLEEGAHRLADAWTAYTRTMDTCGRVSVVI
ncbi:MAG: DNA-binding transcriptional MocR family regulator [Glaciecola sp.]|jgi:DNA-binding transcriptional MocR family regulator